MVEETGMGGGARQFPPTRWSLIQTAAGSEGDRSAALEELLEAYWKPLYFYVRRKGMGVDDAKDAVQEFYARLLTGDFFDRPNQKKGRFRSYLRVCFDNFLRNEHEKRTAKKRGGDVKTISLEVDVAESQLRSAPESPDAAFEREWARGVMEGALERLEAEFVNGRRQGPFEVFSRYFKTGEPPPYEQTAKELDMTVSSFKSFLHRTRERFRAIVREEVVHTIGDEDNVDAEIDALIRALRP
jgi:RNA polymerase sigma factor (sigma-70 family)